MINKIKVWSGYDPAKAQWISAALGATVNFATGKKEETGADTAQSGTKWNNALAVWGNPSMTISVSREVLKFINFIGVKTNVLFLTFFAGEQVVGGDAPSGNICGWYVPNWIVPELDLPPNTMSSPSDSGGSKDRRSVITKDVVVTADRREFDYTQGLVNFEVLDSTTESVISPMAPNPKPEDPSILIVGTDIATSKRNKSNLSSEHSITYQYIDTLTQETMVTTGDYYLKYLISTEYGIIGGIVDINTAREDLHKYEFPYNYVIAGGDIAIPNVAGIIVGMHAWGKGNNPITNAIITKATISTLLDRIKKQNLSQFEKNTKDEKVHE